MTLDAVTWRGYDEVRAAEGIARETIDDYTDQHVDALISQGRAGALPDCEICGAALFPLGEIPWHFMDEDCRAVRT